MSTTEPGRFQTLQRCDRCCTSTASSGPWATSYDRRSGECRRRSSVRYRAGTRRRACSLARRRRPQVHGGLPPAAWVEWRDAIGRALGTFVATSPSHLAQDDVIVTPTGRAYPLTGPLQCQLDRFGSHRRRLELRVVNCQADRSWSPLVIATPPYACDRCDGDYRASSQGRSPKSSSRSGIAGPTFYQTTGMGNR